MLRSRDSFWLDYTHWWLACLALDCTHYLLNAGKPREFGLSLISFERTRDCLEVHVWVTPNSNLYISIERRVVWHLRIRCSSPPTPAPFSKSWWSVRRAWNNVNIINNMNKINKMNKIHKIEGKAFAINFGCASTCLVSVVGESFIAFPYSSCLTIYSTLVP